MADMTPRQRELARHALGLPNDQRKSYRNRFVASPGDNHATWMEMVKAGLAEHDAPTRSNMVWFYLTRAGAEHALDSGEQLDPEDFPPHGGPP